MGRLCTLDCPERRAAYLAIPRDASTVDSGLKTYQEHGRLQPSLPGGY